MPPTVGLVYTGIVFLASVVLGAVVYSCLVSRWRWTYFAALQLGLLAAILLLAAYTWYQFTVSDALLRDSWPVAAFFGAGCVVVLMVLIDYGDKTYAVSSRIRRLEELWISRILVASGARRLGDAALLALTGWLGVLVGIYVAVFTTVLAVGVAVFTGSWWLLAALMVLGTLYELAHIARNWSLQAEVEEATPVPASQAFPALLRVLMDPTKMGYLVSPPRTS